MFEVVKLCKLYDILPLGIDGLKINWAFPEKIRTPYVEDIKSKQKFMTPWNCL